MSDEIKQKRHDWWQKALKSSLDVIGYGTCHKCGKYRPGFINYQDDMFSCIMCRAEELFPDPTDSHEVRMIATTPADTQFESWYELIKTVHHAFEYGLHCNDMTFGEIEDDISFALDKFAKGNNLPVHDWDTDYEEQYGEPQSED